MDGLRRYAGRGARRASEPRSGGRGQVEACDAGYQLEQREHAFDIMDALRKFLEWVYIDQFFFKRGINLTRFRGINLTR